MEAHFATIWESIAAAIPDEDAIVQGGRRVTWRQFDERASRLAEALRSAGVGAGSKVALYMFNGPEYCETYYAALKLRAVPVNVNYRYREDELVYLIDDAGADALVHHRSLGDRVRHAHPRLNMLSAIVEVDDTPGHRTPGDAFHEYEAFLAGHEPAGALTRDEADILVLYTGGTTGMPKGVMLPIGPTVAEMLRMYGPAAGITAGGALDELASAVAELSAAGRQYSILVVPPLMHGTGMSAVLGALTVGGRVVLLPDRGFDPCSMVETARREQPAAMVVVGDPHARPIVEALESSARVADSRDALASVQIVLSAGAILSADVRSRLLDILSDGAVVIDVLASSEAVMGVQMSTRGSTSDTARFLPAPGVKVLTEQGVEVVPGSGERGRVAVARAVTIGYHGDAEKTAQTFQEIDGVRYAFPGDWATVERDGTLIFLGRGSNCINTGGEKVFPEEVEEALKTSPGVADALVFGVADERLGERIEAVISTSDDDATPDQLIEHVRDRLSSYKAPRRVVLVESVPRFDNGKPDYATAKQLSAEVNHSTR